MGAHLRRGPVNVDAPLTTGGALWMIVRPAITLAPAYSIVGAHCCTAFTWAYTRCSDATARCLLRGTTQRASTLGRHCLHLSWDGKDNRPELSTKTRCIGRLWAYCVHAQQEYTYAHATRYSLLKGRASRN